MILKDFSLAERLQKIISARSAINFWN